MRDRPDRRDLLKIVGGALVSTVPGLRSVAVAGDGPGLAGKGVVSGQPEGARVGADVLAAGGNAVDAGVAAALTACVVAIHHCGIGGYGGHLVVALPDGTKATAIDFNSEAPAAAREDMFPRNDKGQVLDDRNAHGWLAAGVPGVLAGLQLALDRYGTQSFSRLVQPAIRYARDGFELSKPVAAVVRAARVRLAKDPGSARLLLPGGEPLAAGSVHRNPDLADLLQTLAERKSVESFYRGDIARQIATAFQKNGGLVTAADLAAYRAHEVEPLELTWRGCSLRTAPLTAGGLTVLQALHVLKALEWENRPGDDPRTTHAWLEALRLAWQDRLRLIGDPNKVQVPVERLLSTKYAAESARRVEAAVRQGKPLPGSTDGRPADGTIHLSAVDRDGLMVALTLTHGGSFGAQVTVPGLGLLLGHGMSRFDPRPGHPNAPGPGKRPLHNMCPTVVLRDGRPVLALGGRGGRRIPCAVYQVLTQCVGLGASLADAVAAPRLHTEGDRNVIVEAKWPRAEAARLEAIGYRLTTGASAVVDAVRFTPDSRAGASASR